jgi:cytochrome c oxidase cbb3-type subunit 2
MNNPRDVVPESNMPAYGWLSDRMVDGQLVQKKMRALNTLGDPYSEEDIAAAPAAVEGKTEMDAVIAYLQGLGHARSGR